MELAQEYSNFLKSVYSEAVKSAEAIHKLYGDKTSKIYPSYYYIVNDISYDLEKKHNIPQPVAYEMLRDMNTALALEEIALYGKKNEPTD